jgi:beta-hydroxylase
MIAEKLLGKAFHKHSLLGDKTFFEPHVLPMAKDLEDNFSEIQKEVKSILARYDELAVFQTISPNQAYIPIDDKWRMFFFKAIGFSFKKNHKVAPVTASIINKYPEICSAYISVLGPKTYLNPHRGPWSGILRMHLGVVVPGHNECTLIVEKEP